MNNDICKDCKKMNTKKKNTKKYYCVNCPLIELSYD